MITSADNPPSPMDLPIDAQSAGLGAPSKVRMKLFTLDNRLILRSTGRLSDQDERAVASVVRRLLAP